MPRMTKTDQPTSIPADFQYHSGDSEALYQQLAERIPHIVFTSSAQGQVDYFNQRWFDYTGATKPFNPMGWADYVHPDDLEFLKTRMNTPKQRGVDYELEYRIRRHDGVYRWHMVRSVPIFDANGNVVRWFGTNTDIHDRKELEDNLSYLSEAHKVLTSSLDYKKTLNRIASLAVPKIADWCMIELIDRNGELEQVALTHKDAARVKWAREFRKKYPSRLDDPSGVAEAIRTGKSAFFSHITDDMLVAAAINEDHLKALRSLGFSSIMLAPLFSDKSCIGCITFVSTETKRQYDQSDLAMADEIASRASLALQNAGLYKSAQEAIVLRDNFISMASHELKTPVTSLRIFTQVLQKQSRQSGDDATCKYLAKMDRQLSKLTDLIFNMLDISKMRDGQMELNKHRFSLDDMAKEIVESLQYGSNGHVISIQGSTGKIIYGDEERIGQVLANLISNAVKYSPNADKVLVHLSTKDDSVVCRVEDFGIGIDSSHTRRIFERFYRVSDEIHNTYPGLGIGLFLSSEIIKRHNGRIWVKSQKGKGSSFSFSLPIAA